MTCVANRDMGIDSYANGKNILTSVLTNMLPFRRLVKNTEKYGCETYNEYDVFRDNFYR